MNKRYAVFSIRQKNNGSIWTRSGSAWMNKDGSMNLYLDVLPIDGLLHVREPGEKRDAAPEPRPEAFDQLAPAGGH
jgi:hypothetical protein